LLRRGRHGSSGDREILLDEFKRYQDQEEVKAFYVIDFAMASSAIAIVCDGGTQRSRWVAVERPTKDPKIKDLFFACAKERKI